MTTAGRRTLRFRSLDEVMPDVEALLAGHTTVGTWSLAQICHHLATVMRMVVALPASTPQDPSLWIGEEAKRRVLETGMVPEGLPAPPQVLPSGALDERVEARALQRAIENYRASSGPKIPHRFLGPLTKAEWDELQLIHVAHHLSFATPNPPR